MVSLLLIGCIFDPIGQIKTPKIKQTTPTGVHSDALYWVLNAQLHEQKGDWEATNKALLEAQIYQPNDPWLYATWGDLAWGLEEKEIAVEKWKKAIQLFGITEKEKRAELQQKINQQ